MRILVLALLLLGGCCTAPPRGTWCVRYTPVTNAERERVSAEVRALLGSPRGSQDIREAYRVACEMWCRPTAWEWNQQEYGWTGRWRELNK